MGRRRVRVGGAIATLRLPELTARLALWPTPPPTWYRHVTLAMVAHAFLVVVRARAGAHKGPVNAKSDRSAGRVARAGDPSTAQLLGLASHDRSRPGAGLIMVAAAPSGHARRGHYQPRQRRGSCMTTTTPARSATRYTRIGRSPSRWSANSTSGGPSVSRLVSHGRVSASHSGHAPLDEQQRRGWINRHTVRSGRRASRALVCAMHWSS
jgi:hypothetical protein